MKLIIFDFDGVLVDTLLPIYEINAEINEDLTMEEFKDFFKGNVFQAFRKDKTAKKRHPDFDNQYKSKTRELKISKELKETVKELASRYTLAIVSSTSTSLIEDILERDGVRSHFSDVYGGDMHENKATKNRILLDKYKVDPEEAVYITDTVGDIKEAREAGIKSIAVTWGFHDDEMLRQGDPANMISTPAELFPAITEIK